MSIIKSISAVVLAGALLISPAIASAGDSKSDVKPYKLDRCMVSGDKLDEMGKPFIFEYKGQEIKLCCKHCKKDFDKNPAKYLKKMHEEEKKAAAGLKPKTDK